MLQKHIVLLLVFAIFSGPTGSSADQPSCSDLGFGSFVLCSDCVHLASFVQDQTLTDECNRCCTPNAAEREDETFSNGILETCPLMMRGVPHLQEFVEKKAKKFGPALKIKYVLGASPRLIMQSSQENGSTAETIVPIAGWKTEHIEEYLMGKLPKSTVTT